MKVFILLCLALSAACVLGGVRLSQGPTSYDRLVAGAWIVGTGLGFFGLAVAVCFLKVVIG